MTAKASRKKGPGRKAFAPTDEDRKNVEALVSAGVTYDQARLVVINPTTGKAIALQTFQNVFGSELDSAKVSMQAKLTGELFRRAMDAEDPKSATLLIFALKTKFGFIEEQKITHDAERPIVALPGVPTGLDPQAFADLCNRARDDENGRD